MNPLLQEAAESVEMGWLLAVMTVVFFACFLGWVWYAYAPQHRALMDEMAQMPLEDGGEN